MTPSNTASSSVSGTSFRRKWEFEHRSAIFSGCIPLRYGISFTGQQFRQEQESVKAAPICCGGDIVLLPQSKTAKSLSTVDRCAGS